METIPELASVTRYIVDQMVVSVGPYMFHSCPQRGISFFARSPEKASPPHNALRLMLPSQPDSISSDHVAGVACNSAAWLPSSNALSFLPSPASSREANITCAPLTSGRYSSKPEMSNDKVVTASNVSSAPIPGCRCMLIRKFTRLRCVIRTPLGLPVDPEVYST